MKQARTGARADFTLDLFGHRRGAAVDRHETRGADRLMHVFARHDSLGFGIERVGAIPVQDSQECRSVIPCL
jgi:hypothetical protein